MAPFMKLDHLLDSRSQAMSMRSWMIAGLVSGTLALTSCTLPPNPDAILASELAANGQSMGASAPAEVGFEQVDPAIELAIPDTWPAAIPKYTSGKLTAIQSDPAGTFFSVTWDVEGQPDVVVTDYGTQLEAAGFTAGEAFADQTSTLTEYTGNGFTVTVYASIPSEDAATQLNVSLVPTS